MCKCKDSENGKIIVIIILWVFYTISLLVFIPTSFHKSVYILKESIVFSSNCSWAKNLAVKGPGAEEKVFSVLLWKRDVKTV